MAGEMEFAGFPVKTATRYELLGARLFGRDVSTTVDGCTLVAYQWRNKIYVLNMLAAALASSNEEV